MEFSTVFASETLERSTLEAHKPAPLFRKSFQVEGTVSSAELIICGLGFYDLFLNGKKLTKGYLAPYISNPDHLVYYDRYDLAPHLIQGENVLAIMLGDGNLNEKTVCWYNERAVFNAAPMLSVTVKGEIGGQELTFDVMSFVCCKGPVTFNSLRGGVFFDRRLEDKNWMLPGYTQDSKWHAPIRVGRPRGKARLTEAEPIVVSREIKPVSITPGELAPYKPQRKNIAPGQEAPPARTGGYIYDFGENNAGIFRLKIHGKPGQKIDIQCAERLDAQGRMDYVNMFYHPDGYVQRDIYICRGDAEGEVFEPMFTYHGFRYLYVSGITPEQATPELLTYLVMSSDLEKRGDFRCSDEMANKIFDAGRRSDISNFYYFPTDCPHREKNGWTGDAAASAEHMILTIGAETSWKEWMRSIRKAQTEEGGLPGVVPTDIFYWGNGPAWDRILFELPYYAYIYRGELDMVRENAHAMLRYLEYVSKKRDEKGIVAFGLGDWVPVSRLSHDYEVPLGFTDSVMVLDMCRKGEILFKAIGLNLNAAYAHALGEEMYEAVRRTYLNTEDMTVESGCQSAQSMAIYYDLFTAEEKPKALEQLMAILRRDNYKLTCGFLGTRVIFHVLAQNGQCQLAYDMITGEEYPSYGHWIKLGKTTLPEHFLPFEDVYPESENHHFLGDVLHWYMRYIGGINVVNHKEVCVRPHFLPNLDFVEAEHCLPDGKISVRWKRENGKVSLFVSHPSAVTCQVCVDPDVEVRVEVQ